jgi:phosphate-selective porin OprO/OprP
LTPSKPLFKGGRGAFELAFRASYVDLSDKDVIGGKESNLSLGFNWYLNYNLRLMTNVIKVLDVKRPGSEYDGMNPLIFALRAQWLID